MLQKSTACSSFRRYPKISFSPIHGIQRFLSPKLKTITPLGLGGVAGGSKYIVHGILFKFALDEGMEREGSERGGREREE
jgi:hypothetical protein